MLKIVEILLMRFDLGGNWILFSWLNRLNLH